jgi:hypothetical protein
MYVLSLVRILVVHSGRTKHIYIQLFLDKNKINSLKVNQNVRIFCFFTIQVQISFH